MPASCTAFPTPASARPGRAPGGFTLVEFATALVIVGVIVAAVIASMKIYAEKTTWDRNTSRVEAVRNAVENYRALQGYYPCPAPLDVAGDTPSAGLAASCAAPTPPAGIVEVTGGKGRKVWIGAVPYRTLNLESRIAADAYGFKLTYAVTAPLAVDAARFDDNGDIDLEDGAGNSLVTPPGSVDYVIVGHGADRKGAVFASSGVPGGTDCSAAPGRDQDNCDRADARFVDADHATVEGPEHFDDFVAFGVGKPAIDRIPLDEISAHALLLDSDVGQTTTPPDRELMLPLPSGTTYAQIEADCHALSGAQDNVAFVNTEIQFLADGRPAGFGTFSACTITPNNGNSGQTRFATPQTLDFIPVPAGATHLRVRATGRKGIAATRLRADLRIVLLGQR